MASATKCYQLRARPQCGIPKCTHSTEPRWSPHQGQDRVQDVCTKSNICFITEEAESLKGTVGDKCKKAAYLCQEEVMAPTCNGAQSATDHAIRKQNHFKYEAVGMGFFVSTVKSTL